MKFPESIELVCLFCSEPLQGPEDAQYASGDLIPCASCGKSNDFDSLIDVAKEKVEVIAREEVEKEMRKVLGKWLK